MQFRVFSLLLVTLFVACSSSVTVADTNNEHHAGRRLHGKITLTPEQYEAALEKTAPFLLKDYENMATHGAQLRKIMSHEQMELLAAHLAHIGTKKSSTVKKILKWAGLSALTAFAIYGVYKYFNNQSHDKKATPTPATTV